MSQMCYRLHYTHSLVRRVGVCECVRVGGGRDGGGARKQVLPGIVPDTMSTVLSILGVLAMNW